MRRMLTNKNVVDIVNQGIESGEITVEGGLPEIQTGDAGKVLTVNAGETGTEWTEVSSGGDSILAYVTTSSADTSSYGASYLKWPTNKSLYISDLSGNSPCIILRDYQASTDETISLSSKSDFYHNTSAADYTGLNSSIYLGVKNFSNLPLTRSRDSILIGCYAKGTSGYNTRSSAYRSIIIADDDSGINFAADRSIMLMPTLTNSINGYGLTFDKCFIAGSLTTGQSNYYNRYINYFYSFGIGHNITPKDTTTSNINANTAYHMMCGKYGILNEDNKNDIFIVGNGAYQANANCFAAGNDSTNGDYIKVGDTMLTETQLQALLASL